MKPQKTRNSQSDLEKEPARGIILPDFRTYHEMTVIKTERTWHKDGG